MVREDRREGSQSAKKQAGIGRGAGAFIADNAYDSDAVVAAAKRHDAEAVIPSKKNRKVAREHDQHWYKERKKVEWFINLLKPYRRVATRYEKTARNFLGFIHVASIMVLLQQPLRRVLPKICLRSLVLDHRRFAGSGFAS
jgi:transposase